MSNFITTHRADGKAVFDSSIPTEHHELPIPIGSTKFISTTHNWPMNLSTEDDIKQYGSDRAGNFPRGQICPPNGTAAAIMTLEPNAESVMHRTMTLDVIVVVDGEIELHLDSGEKRTLKAGDSVVQRGTMHKWVNVTPNDGQAKFVAFAQAIAAPIEIGDQKMETEWAH